MRMNSVKRLFITFVILSLFFSGGCVKRNLHIKSNPIGATVYFNEKDIGVTPLDYDFVHYAVHKIGLKKEGYEPIKALENIKPPLYLWLPFDFFFEIIPYTFWDRKAVTYTLEKKVE